METYNLSVQRFARHLWFATVTPTAPWSIVVAAAYGLTVRQASTRAVRKARKLTRYDADARTIEIQL